MPTPSLTIELQVQGNDRIDVRIRSNLTGQSQGVVTPPFSGAHQRQAVALALEEVRFALPAWQSVPEVFQALKDLGLGNDSGFTRLRDKVGKALFDAVFPPGNLREALHASLNAATTDSPARIELSFRAEDADIGAYPWELLYEEPRGFLFSNPRAALARYVACTLPVPELITSDAINLLLVAPRPVSRPTDPIQLPTLVDSESKAISEGLAEPLARGAIHLDPLPDASPSRSTWEQLNDYLTMHKGAQAPHILHFDGHGGFGQRCAMPPAGCGLPNLANDTCCRACGRRLDGPPQGYLAFESRNKQPHWVSAEELSNLLIAAGVRLAVLTACKSAVVAGQSVFSGMGPALIKTGVPAVVAMQFSVTDEAARGFTHSFYLALAQYEPLTRAMGLARASLFAYETAWYRPVLYLRTDAHNPDGRLFTRTSKPEQERAEELRATPLPDSLRPHGLGQEAFGISPGSIRQRREPDEFSRVGGEFHWDRSEWVDEFLKVVRGESGKGDIRVMAFPAPPEADPDGFVRYLEAKCTALSTSSQLAPRIVPIRLQLTDSLHPFPMVARLLDLLASQSDDCRDRFRKAAERIRNQWQPRETRYQLDQGVLAQEFADSLCEAAKTCRLVVLLHSFDAASEDLRAWILFTWLEVHQAELAGTVVAVAGNQGLGLEEQLNQPPHMICRPPLPAMHAYDLWEWAYYGHGLTWLPLEFVTKYNREHMNGSARSFSEFIETCKAFEDWCSKGGLAHHSIDTAQEPFVTSQPRWGDIASMQH